MNVQVGQTDKKNKKKQQSSINAPVGPHVMRRVRKDPAILFDVPNNELTPKIRTAMSQLMSEIDELKNELDSANERIVLLENIADEDPLVPTLNRRGFMRELEKSISFSRRYGTETCLLYIDVDGFKPVNDTYGHRAGDAALRHIADFLSQNVRQSDVVARIGGDEFAIILQHADLSAAIAKSEHLEKNIRAAPCIFEDIEIPLKITVGAAELRKDDSCADIMARADETMYAIRARRRSPQKR